MTGRLLRFGLTAAYVLALTSKTNKKFFAYLDS
jgi:hypothetical protein